MRRAGLLLILAALWAPQGFAVPNPDDLEFRIRFLRNSVTYHGGESIEVEILYSSQAEKKYRGSWTGPRPELENIKLRITPVEGVTDLRDLRRGFAASILSGNGYVTAEPVTERLDVNDWYGFRKPGHYSLTITSNEVSRVKTGEEGGGEEHLTLESNPLEFDVITADPSWSAAEFAEIERVLDHSEDQQERITALHHLAILDNPASVKRLAELYLSPGPEGDPSGYVYRGLNNSSHVDLIVALLESSLSDPAGNPHGLGADLLAEFQVRKELGITPRYPGDAAKIGEWTQELEKRRKTYDRYFARANGLLLASLERRTGPERLAAIYEAWNNAERQNAGKPETPEILARLRADVLASAKELQPGQQIQFLFSEWPILPHEPLRPIVESLATDRREDAEVWRSQAYQSWCQDWPRECSVAIVAEAMRAETKLNRNVVLLLPEAEHPELDAMLEEQLRSTEPPKDWSGHQRMGALVLRAGSRKLRATVDALLDRSRANEEYSCESKADLIGYLFRFAATDAAKRALEEANVEKGNCGSDLLRTLHQVRYTDELIPVVVKALDSPNLGTAGTAALFLGVHGPASVEEDLWRRLEALREAWRERAGELRAAETTIFEGGIREQTALLERGQTAQLEQALVSGLVTGANWKLTSEERERLREGCLTEKCSDIADGKMSLNL
jgi:hypothetical protein